MIHEKMGLRKTENEQREMINILQQQQFENAELMKTNQDLQERLIMEKLEPLEEENKKENLLNEEGNTKIKERLRDSNLEDSEKKMHLVI